MPKTQNKKTARALWSREETMIAFNLYSKMPFGSIHADNPNIVKLADMLGRPPGSLSWKMCNLASLDPALSIKGTRIATMERVVWDEFNADPGGFLAETERLTLALSANAQTAADIESEEFPQGTTSKRIVEVRDNQSLFREFVLPAYDNRCCITGIDIPALLTASHIIPWKTNTKERLNPHNGLCLNALHDRAFDRGLITVAPDFVVHVSPALKHARESAGIRFILDAEGQKITKPTRHYPNKKFLRFHNNNIFQT